MQEREDEIEKIIQTKRTLNDENKKLQRKIIS